MFTGLGFAQILQNNPQLLARLRNEPSQPFAQGPGNRNTSPPVQLPQLKPQFQPADYQDQSQGDITQALGLMPQIRESMHAAVLGPLMQPNFGVPQIPGQGQSPMIGNPRAIPGLRIPGVPGMGGGLGIPRRMLR